MIWCIKTYIIAYVKTQRKIRYNIHYVKPTAQTPQGQSVAKHETPLQNIQVE